MDHSFRLQPRRSIHASDDSKLQCAEASKDREDTENEDDTASHSSLNDDELFLSQEDSLNESSDVQEKGDCIKYLNQECSLTKEPRDFKKKVIREYNATENDVRFIRECKVSNFDKGKTQKNFDRTEDVSRADVYKNERKRSLKDGVNNENWNFFKILSFVIPILLIAAIVCGNKTEVIEEEEAENRCNNTIIDIHSDIWDDFKSGINLVIRRKKPSIFLFIYKDLSEEYVDDVVKNLSEYASCYLKASDSPIELSKTELTSSRAKSNYGYILDEYRNKLEANKVMVVKHLEQIPGVVAQIFHTFCDEVTPLVEESLFILTMKVDDFNRGSDSRLVQDVLRERWAELHEDVFDPLLTRISSMIVRIEK